ncbi:MAG: serine/threonine-protein kinase, partial [Pseudomonadota bacterium]
MSDTTRPESTTRAPVDGAASAEDRTGAPSSGEGGDLPSQIGPFRIRRELGHGGMGSVYLAEQLAPMERVVALKLVRASLRSPEAIIRFEAERQAMARLSHPNVATLYEAGTTDDGFPYFAMEFVPGEALIEYCDARNLSLDARLHLFLDVCDAVQHAHQKGLLHRDLKPDNILVTEVQGRAVPKVIDFGIAKALDEPLHAELRDGAVAGTPAFMSPEALRGSRDLDTSTDVYALGVLLYRLVTGLNPFRPGQRQVEDPEPPQRPSTQFRSLLPPAAQAHAARRSVRVRSLLARLERDLDWIILKAMENDRQRRYRTAQALATDLNHYLEERVVDAVPATLGYRAGRFIRRHRLAVLASSALILALIIGFLGTTVGLMRALEAEREARQAEAAAELEADRAERVSEFLVEIFKVSDPGEARGSTITARELLDRGAERLDRELRTQPLVRGRLMGTVGEVYSNLGLFAEAERMLAGSLELRGGTLPATDAELIATWLAVGRVQSLQGEYEAATKTLEAGLELLRSDPAVAELLAEGLVQLAALRRLLGRPDDAEALGREAIDVLAPVADRHPQSMASALTGLGWFLTSVNRQAEAIPLLEQALAILTPDVGNDHPEVAILRRMLGASLLYAGRYEEAERELTAAIEVQRSVLPASHPELGESYSLLGQLYSVSGQSDKALTWLELALETTEAGLGSEHPTIALIIQRLGLAYADQGSWDLARAAFERELAILEAIPNIDDRMVGLALNNLGWVLSDGLSQLEEGERILQRAVLIFESGNDPDQDYWVAISRWSLANNLR